jgi:small subunit ribosomal protein S6
LNTYKGIFIFDAATQEDALESMLDRIGKELDKLGGRITRKDVVGRRSFARPMDKRDAGVYVNLYFELDPEKVAGFQERLKLNEDVFRVQILKEALPAAEAPRGEEQKDG